MKPILATALAHLAVPCLATVVSIPNVLSNGTTTAESISVAGNLDAPKLTPYAANQSSYDWWYFDATSRTDNSSVSVIFFNSGPDGFAPSDASTLYIGINVLYPNGTSFATNINATSSAVFDYDNDSIFGDWSGSGVSFHGWNLTGIPEYHVTIDAPDYEITGTLKLTSRAPSHYPCGKKEAGQTEQLLPHVFWANMIPDAATEVNLTVEGFPVSFVDGVGYHDKNWGDAPFSDAVSSWYWGHANLGPYSIVWFDALDLNGTEYYSGYVSKDRVFIGGCEEKAVVVRPWGENSTYPPIESTGAMEGLGMTFDLGAQGKFFANVTTGAVITDLGTYLRNIGTVTGGLVGSNETFDGFGVFEEFKYETS